jgi:alpha-D-ribose 1-methylphosphonate 5-triphosphate synthase subunit PhnG
MHDARSHPTDERRAWLALLARAPRALIETALAHVGDGAPLPAFDWLRAPQTGLAMVRGRIGGTGDAFNLGEATVTRAVLRLRTSEGTHVGIACQLGRDKRRAELAALADALLQTSAARDALRTHLLDPLSAQLAAARHAREAHTASTRVDFFTMVRGE